MNNKQTLDEEFVENLKKHYEELSEAPAPTPLVKHPLTGQLQAKPKQSKRQARLEALYGKPRTIVVPRGPRGRGLTAEEIRAGLDASAERQEPTYLRWDVE